ncbi:Glycosyltransferase [Rhynchospora pubera]|uniref:Glycosyltransferase n=1 Tax=Rhynchospora pubera TaxID=906938 RepID=A0AAV8D4X1_9POAL|nr:Glycosyltransferase [Rhynchospora pubera]
MASSSPRVFLLPFPAYGLMILMVNLASLFASRGIDTTVITTPRNASFFPSHLNFLLLPSSPFTTVGLPSGCENLADLPQPEHQHMVTFMHAMSLLREPLAALLAEHSPTCLVSDYRCPWTVDMGIPRIVFQPTGVFSAAVSDIIYTYKPHKRMEDPMEQFLIPGGIPHPICITRSELPGIFNLPRDAFQSTKESLCQCLGVIFHTFYELEPWYVDYLKESGPKKVWCAGVLPLYKKRIECTEAKWEPTKAWLDSKKPSSVIYLCFGSTSVLGEDQLQEIAAGLHASNHPFLWVVKGEWPAKIGTC